jgi:hypothetical protein
VGLRHAHDQQAMVRRHLEHRAPGSAKDDVALARLQHGFLAPRGHPTFEQDRQPEERLPERTVDGQRLGHADNPAEPDFLRRRQADQFAVNILAGRDEFELRALQGKAPFVSPLFARIGIGRETHG